MSQEEFSLDRYLAEIWRAKWIILIGTMLAAGVAAYLTSRQPTMHRATALIKIGRVWKEPLEDPYLTAKVTNSAGFLNSVAEKDGGKHKGKIRRSVSAETIVVGPRRSRYPILLSVAATTDDPGESVRLAVTCANAVIERHQKLFDEAIKPHLEAEQRLDQRWKEFSAHNASAELLLKLEDELHQVRANNSLADPNVTEKTHLVEEVVPDATIAPDVRRNAGAAALIAAVLLISGAAIASHLRKAPQADSATTNEAASQANA